MLVFFCFYQSMKDGDRIIHQEEKLGGLKEPALSGRTLQLTPKVRYLELILGK
jgi:hypothetical protein